MQHDSRQCLECTNGERLVAGAVLAGVVSLIERNARHRERLLYWLQQQAAQRTHLHDVHVQPEVARSLFGAHARELTIDLAAHWVHPARPRAHVRERLYANIVDVAMRALATMREGGCSVWQLQQDLQAQVQALAERGAIQNDMQEKAAAFVRMRRKLPAGVTDAEWASLQEGPMLAVLHLSAAASNGPRELLREFRRADHVLLDMALEQTQDVIVGAVFHAGMSTQRLRQLVIRYPSRRTLLGQLQNCLAVSRRIGGTAHKEYGRLVSTAARQAATAASERELLKRRRMLESESRALQEIERLVAF